ncbi:MAG: RNA-binding protein, partial [Deltaproteobacteria bacterium]|nr:RNA-binding protein [Deltaproteobacteria bacterium]
MANKNLFKSIAGKLIPAANTVNSHGAPAYALTAEQALAQYAMTGCLNATFYASAEDQLAAVLDLANKVEPEFVAKLAIYARESGHMKDLPALLCAVLSMRDPQLLKAVFPRVIDSGKMLRNFVQIMRSGTVGRKSLGSLPKKLVLEWLNARSEDALFRDSVGASPSLEDVVKMVHPKPTVPEREAFYGYLLGKAHNAELLPKAVKEFEAYKAKTSEVVPAVPFQMLTSLSLGKAEWIEIARNAGWQMTRMNLNTFLRHGVFEERFMVLKIAERLRDKAAIRKAKAFPYQLMTAYLSVGTKMPLEIKEALQDAMEIAVENIPAVAGRVVVCTDVSGSMRSPATGYREGSTTATRCIDVAALLAAAMLRKNTSARVIPFEQHVVNIALNPRDSIMTNAQKLAAVGGGGTNCSAPLAMLNAEKANAELVLLVSDNESWLDARRLRGTGLMEQWQVFKARNPAARLVCLDIQPNTTTQALGREDILNVGGFSDAVFEVIGQFAEGRMGSNYFVEQIRMV